MNLKNLNMEQKRKTQNDKPKLIKRDSKVKKVTNPNTNNIGVKNNKKITPINKSNKSTIDSASSKKRKFNEIQQNKISINNKARKNNININDNKNIKQRFEEYILQQNRNEDRIIKKKRFNNIDEAVILIQRCFREYLDMIHNTNSNLMKLINQRKKNLLDNYNNDNEIMLDLYQKNSSDKKSKKLNEDIIIEDKKNSDENKYNNKELINIKNMKINLDLDDIDNNKEIKYANKISNNKNNNENDDNQYSVFERIYKNMQKQEQNKNEANNDNFENNKFGLDDDLIEKKDNIIDNQLDMIKNIQKRAIENLSIYKNTEEKDTNNNKSENKEEKIEKINEKIYEDVKNDFNKEIIEEKKDEQKNEENINPKNNEALIEKIQDKEVKEVKEKKEEKEENKDINLKNNLEEKNIIDKSNNEKNENEKPSKNEIFQRLANFLDSTVENPEKITEPPKKEEIEFQTEVSNPKELTENILSKDNSENIALNLELKEAKKTIDTMSSVINDLKLQLKSKDDFLNKALLSQKSENDILLQRQNTLMESLISEKRNMEMQLSELQSKLNEAEKLNYKKLQKMRENYETETRKNKEAWFQAEKIRRKKWEENKIKEIKELTAKGLEPEVERIISNHKNEMSTLEEKYLLEMKNLKEKLVEEYEIKFDEIKKKYVRERDEGIEAERNLASMKLRNQSERLEDEITEERRRWNAKLNSEIQRLESLREKDKKIYEDQIMKLEERNKKNIFSNENFYQKKYDDIKSEYENKLKMEIFNSKKNLEEKNNEILSQKESELDKKYKEMKSELLKDRDKQINIIIEKLGEESLNERKKNIAEIEKKANEKNLSLIEENNGLKNKITDLTNKLQAESKNRINLEQNIEILTKKLKTKELNYDMQENTLKNLQQNYDDVVNKLSGLTRDFNLEKKNLENEVNDTLQQASNEVKMYQKKLEENKNLFEKEKTEIEERHKNEIESIEQKIKKSFMRKDEIIRKLQDDVEKKDLAIRKYEELLNQQRKELFGK